MEFVKRNMPVMIIGAITVLIFLGIVVMSQKRPPTGPGLTEVSKEGLISDHTYTMGNPNALVTLVEFSDFECPFCKAIHPIVNNLAQLYPNQLKIAYRHFPLPQHKLATKAAEGAQIAGGMGKFWEYVDILFENQEKLDESSLISYAQKIGLDPEKFKTALDNGSAASQVISDVEYGKGIGVDSTPTFYLNGKRIDIKQYGDVQIAVEKEIKKYYGDQTGNVVPQSSESTQTVTKTATPKTPAQNLPDITINFTDKGFDQNDITAEYGQTVKWTNKTGQSIVLVQTVKKFDELKDGVTIAPNASFSLQLNGERLWVYKEQNSNLYGQIFINPKPKL